MDDLLLLALSKFENVSDRNPQKRTVNPPKDAFEKPLKIKKEK